MRFLELLQLGVEWVILDNFRVELEGIVDRHAVDLVQVGHHATDL